MALATSPCGSKGIIKAVPPMLLLLLPLLLLGPDAAAQTFVPEKLECADACAGGGESADGCADEGGRISCSWEGDLAYTRDRQKLGRAPGWSRVAHKDQKTAVDLGGNEISIVKDGEFALLPNLEQLSLSRNMITKLEQRSFEGLEKLRWLFLEENRITELVAGVFDGLLSLTHIDLQNNKIAAVAPFAHRLPSLTRACGGGNTGLCTAGNPVADVDKYYGTFEPTANPTEPTAKPSTAPTATPTANPTDQPTANPTDQPTAAPTITMYTEEQVSTMVAKATAALQAELDECKDRRAARARAAAAAATNTNTPPGSSASPTVGATTQPIVSTTRPDATDSNPAQPSTVPTRAGPSPSRPGARPTATLPTASLATTKAASYHDADGGSGSNSTGVVVGAVVGGALVLVAAAMLVRQFGASGGRNGNSPRKFDNPMYYEPAQPAPSSGPAPGSTTSGALSFTAGRAAPASF